MIRVVVAVLLAVALLAVSLPLVEQTARDRSDAEVRSSVDEIDAAATDLARTEETVPDADGARRLVIVELPASGPVAAEVRHLTIDPSDDTFRFRIAGASERSVRSSVPLETVHDRPLELGESGTHRLTLSLVAKGGDRRVLVERAESVGRDDAR